MLTIHGFVFREMQKFWENLRIFFRYHKTLFDASFLLIYTVQQLLLLLVILLFPEYSSIFSGIFALIVITTISFEKVCMESRYGWLEEKLTIQEMDKQRMATEYEKTLNYSTNIKQLEKSENIK